jgi:hypothetical protein
MRAKEFIIERQLPQRRSDTLSTTFHFPTMSSADAYKAYKFGVAMADHTMAYAEGPASNDAIIVAYTPEEEEIIQAGTRQTGHKGRILANKGSNEPGSTDTLSPVAKPKRNRYGV